MSVRYSALALAATLLGSAILADDVAARAAQTDGSAAAGTDATGVLMGAVIDEVHGAPLAAAELTLMIGPADESAGAGAAPWVAVGRFETGNGGGYRFDGLSRGHYRLSVQRFGYRSATIEIHLDRAEPIRLTIALVPEAFPVGPLVLLGSPSSLFRPGGAAARGAPPPPMGRAEAVRARRLRYLSGDVRTVDLADIRESNTLAEDDVFRALQMRPGVARRDDYSADLWTRGAPSGQTVVTFDGIPVHGAFHALGVLSGFSADMLASATLHPGVESAASQGGGAATVALETASPARGSRRGLAGLSPVSARVTLGGRPADDLGWAVGARRSHLDILSWVADGLVPGDGPVEYAFADITGRVDVPLGAGRLEASAFVQDDRVFGDVPGVASGNEGEWGTRVARVSLVTRPGRLTVRHTAGLSVFSAGVRTTGRGAGQPVHPPTAHRYGTLLWESRAQSGGAAGGWSAGLTALREGHHYDGPGVDLARLLTPDELARRGFVDLTGILVGVEHPRIVKDRTATRVALWGVRRLGVGSALDVEAGLRLETGDRLPDGRLRLAPRLLARYRPWEALSLSAAIGRSYQYTQSLARTDVVRRGLRVSELLVQADRDTPALRSDVATVGLEASAPGAWLLGATGWWRESAGVLLPDPAAGPVDGPPAMVVAEANARGVELWVRKLEGRLRGFGSYALSRSRQRVRAVTFDAAEDRRHVASLGLEADLLPSWLLGATARVESGAPYTRLTLVSTSCGPAGLCDPGSPPVLLGTAGGQRGPAYAALDLRTEWTHAFEDWSLTLYGQLRNVLGRSNDVTYHSSCLCIPEGAAADAFLGDAFEAGLPRLPVLGLRARF